MEEPKTEGTFIVTQPSEKYFKALMAMQVCLDEINNKEYKLNDLTKKKIIVKGSVSVKKCLQETRMYALSRIPPPGNRVFVSLLLYSFRQRVVASHDM